MKFLISLFYVLLVHVSVNVYAADDSCDFPAIFNFGDGNSDVGSFSALFGFAPPFYGDSYFNTSTGRGNDGRLMIDFMANSLGKPFLQPYLDSIQGDDFSYGANFASDLSTIAPPKLIYPQQPLLRGFGPIYLDIQLSQFRTFLNRSQIVRNKGGRYSRLMPKLEYFSKGLYTIDIGQNEISQALFLYQTTDEIKAIIPTLIDRVSLFIQNLYALGARTFWIHNTGPIGCLAYKLTINPVPDDQLDSLGCSKPHNELSQYYNSVLKDAVVQLRKDLPSAAFTYVDLYSARLSLIQEPQKYGFKPTLAACCGFGGKYNFGEFALCGNTTTVNGTQVLVSPCENPSQQLNWDGIQYTEAADEATAKKIASGEYSDPPNSLKNACRK